jgi:DNA repair protein SbcC/Rad50
MQLLSRLFRSKPKILTLEEQLAALPNNTSAQLKTLLSGDAPEAVKEAAIGFLPYDEVLLTLAKAPTGRQQMAARKRIGELLDTGVLAVAQLIRDVPRQIELLALASCSVKASLELVEQVESSTVLVELACNGPTTHIRQAAANKVEGRDDLEQLAKVAQNKDKTVYKIARTKLDVFKIQDALDAKFRQGLETLCEKLEALGKREADHLYKGKFLAFDNEWLQESQNGTVPADVAARYERAKALCQEKIASRAEVIAKEEEKIALEQQARQFVEAALHDMQNLLAKLYTASHMDELKAMDVPKKIQELSQAITLAARNIHAAEQVKLFNSYKERAQNLFARISESGPVTQALQQLQNANSSETAQHAKRYVQSILQEAKDFQHEQITPWLTQSKEQFNAWLDTQKEKEDQAKQMVKDLADLTRRGVWAAEQGMVRRARGIYKDLQEKIQQTADGLPANIASKMADFEQLMHKLGDWHEFAVTPKKEDLIRHMQSLSDSKLAPNDLASKIHELQDQWKELSRGGQQSDESLWEQFQAASIQAYTPCKEYFEQQTLERENNLIKRTGLIAQLQAYLEKYDWKNAVWKDVEKTLKLAREEWKTYWPVPRKMLKEQQAQFDALLDQLHGKIKAEYQANKNWKEKIIAEAAELKNAVDLAAAAEKVKQLQQQWKSIGRSWPKDDQNLWDEFRKQCDAVFEKRKQLYEEVNAQRDAIVEKAHDYLNQLKSWVESAPEAITNAKTQIDEIKIQFEGLGELPRKAAQELTQQYHHYSEQIKQALQDARKFAQAKAWTDVFTLADILRRYECERLATNDSLDEPQALTAAWSAIAQWPAGTQDVLTKRKQLSIEDLRSASANAQNALEILCIRAEILGQKETPEAFKSQRMSYQVEQLKLNFGKRDETIEALTLEWLSLPGVADEPYAVALQRFNACK